ncbi:MAG TPA: hypothetical protein VH593_25145 [Ktedonobacteraceae bacterium]|jgi:hypothetical protein
MRTYEEYTASELVRMDRAEERYQRGLCVDCDQPATTRMIGGTDRPRANGMYCYTFGVCREHHDQHISPCYLTPDL